MYDYSPETCLIKDTDGQLYNIIDLWNGIKKPVDLSTLTKSYAVRSSQVRNIDGTDVNIIDTILEIAQGSINGSIVMPEITSARGRYKNLARRLDRENKKIYETINAKDYLSYKGESISIPHAKVGFTKDMKIEGKTLQNISNLSFKDYSDFINVDRGKYTISDGYITGNFEMAEDRYIACFSKKISLLKPSTEYTIVVEIPINTLTGQYYLTSGVTDQPFTSEIIFEPKTVGVIKRKVTTKANLTDITTGVRSVTSKNITGKIKFRYYILEGDYTNKEIPAYFEGIKSVGDINTNNIEYLSYSNLVNMNEPFYPIIGKEHYSIFYDCYIPKGIDFTFTVYSNKSISSNKTVEVIFFDKDKNRLDYWTHIGKLRHITKPFTKDVHYVKIRNIPANNSTTQIDDIKIVLGETIDVNPYGYGLDKRRILLPFSDGLKGLTNVKDSIETKEDGIYAIQRIRKMTLSGIEDWNLDLGGLSNTVVFYLRDLEGAIYGSDKMLDVLSDFAKTANVYSGYDEECIRLGRDSVGLYIRIKKDKLKEINVQSFKEYLQTNNITIYYRLAEPIKHKISDVSILDLKTYLEMTYIFSENIIKPTIYCKAATSPQAVISDISQSTFQIANKMGTKMTQLEQVDKELSQEGINQTATDLEMDFRLFELEDKIIPASSTFKLNDSSPYSMIKKCILNKAYEKTDMEHKINRYYEGKRLLKEEQEELLSLL